MTAPAYFIEEPSFNYDEPEGTTILVEVDEDGRMSCCDALASDGHFADCRCVPDDEPGLEICRHCRRDIYFETYRDHGGEWSYWLDTEDGSAYCGATLAEDAPEDTEPGLHEPDTD